MKMRNPERRLRAWTQMSLSKRVCEHTGGPQPTYRLEHGTLRIMAEFPLVKNDDEEMAVENVERKQVGGWVGGWVGAGWVGAGSGLQLQDSWRAGWCWCWCWQIVAGTALASRSGGWAVCGLR